MLRCYLGMALAKGGRVTEALEMLAHATHADKRNPLARFERSRVLMGLDRFDDALEELEALKVSPRKCILHVCAWRRERATRVMLSASCMAVHGGEGAQGA